jgi:hypothetical protein
MPVKVRKTRIVARNGTSAQWASTDPVLMMGERGWDSSVRRAKTGDGISKWSELLYDDDPEAYDPGDLAALFESA